MPSSEICKKSNKISMPQM